ncbi:hypothetical protein [Halobacteriovorax sp. JY17]|uniref:hypothetical protein n=1 Tax=Halobacteriovorax sp. JY17 TaxID=2014617 RepID=UPI000C4EDC76|nr:hypothetical protein [Halobacteriovorax sp. JY17]PIK13543.1 MAG: hypothetical protein CES88_15240 [Halobacteriovorax sp. JY17]
MSEAVIGYKLNDILFSRIVGHFENYEPVKFKISYFISAEIESDDCISLKMGIQLAPEDFSPGSKVSQMILVECIGVFKTKGGEIPKMSFVEEFNLAPNMLATLYPFLREKVHYLFSANRVNYFLDSFNIINFLNNNKEKFKVEDKRK